MIVCDWYVCVWMRVSVKLRGRLVGRFITGYFTHLCHLIMSNFSIPLPPCLPLSLPLSLPPSLLFPSLLLPLPPSLSPSLLLPLSLFLSPSLPLSLSFPPHTLSGYQRSHIIVQRHHSFSLGHKLISVTMQPQPKNSSK